MARTCETASLSGHFAPAYSRRRVYPLVAWSSDTAVTAQGSLIHNPSLQFNLQGTSAPNIMIL